MDSRILIIDSRVITPTRDGGSLRMSQLLRIFLDLGLSVDFLPAFPLSFPPFDATLEQDAQALASLGVCLVGEDREHHLEHYLSEHGAEYEFILVSGAYLASRAWKAVTRHAPQASKIFDTIDLHHVREFRQAKVENSVPRLRNALKVKQIELSIANAADLVFVVSEKERETLLSEGIHSDISVIPNIHELPERRTAFADREGFLYLGGFSFEPNVDAIRYFISDIHPLMIQSMGNIPFHIVGADPPAEIRALESEHIHVTGHLPDLDEIFNRVLFSVCPLRFGAGIKGKALLSMSYGVPVISTAIGAEGIDASASQGLLIAEHAQDWEAMARRLSSDQAMWENASSSARNFISGQYSYEGVKQKVLSSLQL